MKTLKLGVSLTALGVVTACGGGSSAVSNQPTVQIGQEILAGNSLAVTIDRVYANGAAIGTWENAGANGLSYRSDPTDLAADPGSTVVSASQTGRRNDQQIVASSTETGFDRSGTRYTIAFNDGEYAASQIRTDVSGSNMDLATWGTTIANLPTGTLIYGAANDNSAFINIDGETVQLPFSFTANLETGEATLTADNGTYEINGGSIALDVATGSFYGSSAQIGASGALVDANVHGGLFGDAATGVAGIVHSTDAAAPSVTGNFVGTR